MKCKVRNRNREGNKTRYSKKGVKSMSYNRRARDNTGPYAKVRINKKAHLAGRHTHSLSQYLYFSLSRFQSHSSSSLSRFQSFSPLLIFFVPTILSPLFTFFVSIILSPLFIFFVSIILSPPFILFLSPSLFFSQTTSLFLFLSLSFSLSLLSFSP